MPENCKSQRSGQLQKRPPAPIDPGLHRVLPLLTAFLVAYGYHLNLVPSRNALTDFSAHEI